MDSETPWLVAARGTKRTHDELDVQDSDRSSPTLSPSRDTYGSSEGAIDGRRPPPQLRIHLPPLPRRFQGDGFDWRRPAALSAHSSNEPSSNNTTIHMNMAGRPPPVEVIDLSSEDDEPSSHPPESIGPNDAPLTPAVHSTFGRATRGPRFAADIIDLTEDLPESSHRPPPQAQRQPLLRNPPTSPQRSPEIQFVSARQLRLPTPPPQRQPAATARWSLHIHPTDGETQASLDEVDNDIEITGERILNSPGPGLTRAGTANLIASANHLNAITAFRRLGASSLAHRIIARANEDQGISGFIHNRQQRGVRGGSDAPIVGARIHWTAPALNFGIVGFDMGLDREETASPPIPPPAAAPAGYTRDPKEGEVYVCENCGDQLSRGDSDCKRQIWLARCGHLYCGECTQARAVSKRKQKEPQRTKPFKECVVEGCRRKLTAKTAMLQIFL